MKGGRQYDIFPRTWKARVLLGLAFLGGSVLMVGFFGLIVAGALLVDFEPRCKGDDLEACLEAQVELRPLSQDQCDGIERRVCLVPLGRVSTALVEHLTEHFRDRYGLTVTVLTPHAVPREIVNERREQIDAGSLIHYMASLHPEAYGDPQVVLIGITPVDLYDQMIHYRYVFGVKGPVDHPKAVVSTSRMDIKFLWFGEEILHSRARKLVTKYIGLLYYQLPPSDDPRSVLYDSILGPQDLDRMREDLPVAVQP